MKSLMGIGSGKKPVFDKAAGTLTFTGTYASLELDSLQFILNVTKNKVIYSKANSVEFNGNLVAGANETVYHIGGYVEADYDLTDEFHVWVETNDGVSSMDFLSELAMTNQSYAALSTLGFVLEDGDVNFSFNPTNLESNIVTQTTAIDNMKASIDKLLQVPDTFIVDKSGNAPGETIDISTYPAASGDPQMFVSVKNIDSSNQATIITLNKGGNPVLSNYSLTAGNYVDIKFDEIVVASNAVIQITLLEQL